MTRNSSHKRFPRAAYTRRIWEIMDELEDWRRTYVSKARSTDSPYIKRRLVERIEGVDEVYHHLSDALSSWKLWV